MKKRKKPYIGFIAPAFFLYTLFMIIPIFIAMYYSFFQWNGITDMKFIGLDNYKTILLGSKLSKTFYNALFNNFKYLACVLLIITPIQIFFAYIIYIKIPAHTTAAGDCFNGAFIVGLAEGCSISSAIDFANRASSIVVTRKGAQSSIPSISEVSV
jgi:ABC-type sugar transport system permease subunit